MKKYLKTYYILPGLLLILLASGGFFQACKKDSGDGGGTPAIRYIRITDPLKSDSLIAHAFMGNNVAIIGDNLQNVVAVWFNDQSAILNTSFITSNTIIVGIPNKIPGKVTNELKLIFKDSSNIIYPFGVDVPVPMVSNLVCEYVPDAGTAVIQGNFFIDDPSAPLTVIFPGNIAGQILSFTLTEIKVKVPAGIVSGPIVVKSIYGSTRSSFFFRDDRNILLDFDVLTAATGWRSGVLGNSNPDPISGNYVKFQGDMVGVRGSTWNEDAFSFNFWPKKQGRPDVTYNGDIAHSAIKFECNVLEPWKSGALQMIFTPYDLFDTNSYIGDAKFPRGLWIPWKSTGSFQTAGWTTITIPLSEFKYAADGTISSVSLTKEMMKGLTFFVFNGGIDGVDCKVNMCIDNIRIVPFN